MKKFALSFAILALMASNCLAFDWKSESNEQLRSEMLEFAREFSKEAKGTKAGRMLRRFVRQQENAVDRYVWITEAHALVDQLESIYGPARSDYSPMNKRDTNNAEIRKKILKLLDYPLHVDNYAKDADSLLIETFNKATQEYLAGGREGALKWLSQPAPAPGTLEICKVYNMGYLLRTSERTFAIDIRWDGSEEEARFVAEKIDAIFLTHPHSDHYSELMLKCAAEKGKMVILPSDVIPSYGGMNKVCLTQDIISPVEIAGIKVQVVCGDQGENIPNNIYLLDFDGWRLVHQGDNARYELEAELSELEAVDVLIAACWNNTHSIISALQTARGASEKPLLYIPGHENEMCHSVNHRESYWELFNRKDRLGDPDFNNPPYVLIDNGESVQLFR